MRRWLLPAVCICAAAFAPAAAPSASASPSTPPGWMLVELRPSASCTAAAALVRAGGSLVVPELNLYRIARAAASRVVPGLRRAGAVRLVQHDRPAGILSRLDFADPLVASEWWRPAVRVDTLTAPGVGTPVTVVDSGIDVTHPEFLGRANTLMLNAQEPEGLGGEHGTAVASIVGAPANGLGTVGIYPEALLRSWDAAKGQGTRLDTSEIAQGILAAANDGPGVINLSLGSDRRELVIEQAVYEAVRKGSLVVAAAGNDGETGSPPGYPASLPHVLTVGATNRDDGPASFSSRSRFVDLAAPGQDIQVATAIGKGFQVSSGTSFSAPLVSGAAAWVWTARPELDATQLFEVIRRSARDIGEPGRDDASGYGILDVAGALSWAAPVPDPLEPNDDLDFVRPDGVYFTGIPALTTKQQPSTQLQARLDVAEDPRDVYRVFVPRGATVRAVASSSGADVDLALWKDSALSVKQRFVGSSRLARAATSGPTETLLYRSTGAGRFAYVAVTLPKGVREATYALRVSAR
jgi:hypothetical protein